MTFTRRILAVLTVVCVLLGCCGCLPLRNAEQRDVPDSYTYLNEFQNNRQYKALSAEMKDCYGSVYTALTDGFGTDDNVTVSDDETEAKTQIGISINLPHALDGLDQAKALYKAVANDNPHFFYVANVYGVEGYEKDGKQYYNTLTLIYSMDAVKRKTAKQELDAAVQTILQGAPNTTDEYETELYIHRQLLDRCTYDQAAADEGYSQHPYAYTAYAALVEGKAVCEGYARAMQMLLKAVNIPCALVFGESVSDGEKHMWNYVTVNGNNYHLDPTWNDSGDKIRHNYFNLTTKQISISHRIGEGQEFIPSCSATTENYYHRNGLYFDTYQRQAIAAAIARQIQDGATHVELMFAPDKYDSALLFLKSPITTKEMVNAHLADSGLSLWDYAHYSEREEHILILRKK